MLKLIKTEKYDNLIMNFMHYFYFAYQFFFVLSGTAIIRENGKVYKYFTILMIIPFLVIALCDVYNFLRGKFNLKEIVFFGISGIILLVSLYNYRNVMVIANLIAISAFKDTDGKRALKYYIYATAIAFVITLICGFIWPDLGNVVQTRHGVERTRYGLGFFYCSLGQFYFLSIVLAYILIKEKVKLCEYILFIVIDIVLFIFTDTKAPFAYSIIAIVLFWFVDRFKDTILYHIFGWITVFSSAISVIGMYLMSRFYSSTSVILSKINQIVNSRLNLTHNALEWFGVKIFGQTQPRALADPSCYLDSSTMVMLILNGLLVTILCVEFMMFFSYISYKTKKVAILVVLFFIAFRGAFDLGFMALQFSPVVLLFMPTLRKYLKKK